MGRLFHLVAVALAVALWAWQPGGASAEPFARDYTLFEAGQVRPLALADEGRRLYAVNTPDDRLEVLQVAEGHPRVVGSVAVGLRPVAVAVRNRHEVWVVNHLSDSISVVDTRNPRKPRVVRTLLVGDEPRDIVFAGPDRGRAFITTAHRGQNIPHDPQFSTPGIGRADVWVFDADELGTSLGGEPLAIITLFADTPRALAVSPDGATVYAAAFASGNGTTTVSSVVLPARGETNTAGDPQPHVGLIAKFEDGFWTDSVGSDVSHLVKFELPDYDVFSIDATASPPVQLEGPGATYRGVGTTLFNLAVNPQSGALYVSNTEANNFTRFEGPGLNPAVNTTVRGHIARSRITVIAGGQVRPIHLNKHIDYSQCCDVPGNAEARKSLASPREMVVSEDGQTLYVAAHGSSKIGVFSTQALEDDTFEPDEASHIALDGGGPTGLVLDDQRGLLYVLTRFDNAVAVVDVRQRQVVASVPMHSPEPDSVVLGRPLLYDALSTSSHGDSACASCHVDGSMDQLAWDLGDPTVAHAPIPGTAGGIGDALPAPGTTAFTLGLPTCGPDGPPPPACIPPSQLHFASLKGPMTTQTLRGMDNHGPMHWRGDRTAGTAGDPGAQPDTGMFDERAAFTAFNVAFPGLVGRSEELPEASMEAFTEFALQLMLPPNPVRNLNNSLTPEQARGREIYFGGEDQGRLTDGARTCNGCHTLDPLGNAEHGVDHPGFFGTDGRFSFEGLSEMFKVPHLRNAYDKVGMFGSGITQNAIGEAIFGPTFAFQGEQVRGFGFNNDGSIATVFDFLSTPGFGNFGELAAPLGIRPNPDGFVPHIPAGTFPEDPSQLPPGLGFLAGFNDPMFRDDTGTQEKRAVEAFLLAFDNNLLPVVGQQATLTPSAGPDTHERIGLLINQANTTAPRPACDLVAHGYYRNAAIGYLYQPETGSFRSSDGEAGLSLATLEQRVGERSGRAITFTCVPPGAGERRALDRDGDGVLDGLERRQGSDPADPGSGSEG